MQKGVKKGYKQTEEHKRNVCLSKIGSACSQETRIKIGLANSIKRLGKKASIETKMKMSLNKKGSSNSYWKGGRPHCLDCSIQIGYRAKRCSKCNGKQKLGSKHPCWVNGNYKKQDARNDSAYNNWRKQVWLRDKFTCKISNPDCCGKIEAHHILGWRDFPKLRYQLNNGITLCHAHHPRRRAEEKRLIPVFQELVSVSNEQF